MKEINLFPHNEIAYNDLINCLEDSNFAFLERATGTGKSFILIKYLATQMMGKRVLFVTTHDPMFEQFSTRDMPKMGTSVDDYEKLDCCLYSSLPKHKPEYYYKNYDCIVFDEAHHCGADIWGETVAGIRDLIKEKPNDKVMIGVTATGTRYLDDYMDVASEYFDDNVANRLSLADAILQELLPTPLYVNTMAPCKESLDAVRDKIKKIEGLPGIDEISSRLDKIEEKINVESDVNKKLKMYDAHPGEKYIVFCSSIDDLERKMEEADKWFDGIGKIEKYQAHSGQSKNENQKQIENFSKESKNIQLMFAVDIFNEGMHIDGVDGIIMTRRTASPIVYLQQLGRALSFSARKKQVKIFDLVGNASDIDIIYNLYKDLLEEAKEKIASDPDNAKHYEKIVDRFRIINEDNEVLDAIYEIDSYISDNYLIRNMIERNITLLELFVNTNNVDFMYEYQFDKLDKEHRKLFNDLCKVSNNLSYNDFVRLNNIGIQIVKWQKDENVLKQIEKSGSYKAVIESGLRKCFEEYNHFYVMNNRRVTLNDNPELFRNYRNHIVELKKKRLAQLLRDANYPLNVEEKLLLKDYPTSEEIDKYLEFIENKLLNGEVLDELENKTIRSINQIRKVDSNSLVRTYLSNSVYLLDKYIDVIKKHCEEYPEDYIDKDYLEFAEDDVKLANKYITKYAKYVTNQQFDTLLELNYELPKVINMTKEERLEKLGSFNSFHDLEEAKNSASSKLIIDFINQNKRRPNPDDEKEFELYKKMQHFLGRADGYSKQIVATLHKNGIELSADEKLCSDYKFTDKELEKIFDQVCDDLKNEDLNRINYNLMDKKVNILKRRNIIDNRMSNILSNTIQLQRSIIGLFKNNSFKMIEDTLWKKNSYITPNIINYLEKRNMGISNVITQCTNYVGDKDLNLAYKYYTRDHKKLMSYYEYVEKNGERPEKGSDLYKYLRNYLLHASKQERIAHLDKINKIGCPVYLEEIFLSGEISVKNEEKLYKHYIHKMEKGIELDALANKIYGEILTRVTCKEVEFDGSSRLSSVKVSSLGISYDDDKLNILKTMIDENPYIVFDYKKDYKFIKSSERKELDLYKYEVLGKVFFPEVIKRMNQEHKPLFDVLDLDEIEIYKMLVYTNKTEHKFDLEIKKIDSLSKKIALQNSAIHAGELIDDYILFINVHNDVPDEKSEDPVEAELAKKFKTMLSIMNESEKKLFTENIKKALKNAKSSEYVRRYVEFAEKHKRVPCSAGETDEELKLYRDGRYCELNREQKATIGSINLKYQKNSKDYVMSRRKIRK